MKKIILIICLLSFPLIGSALDLGKMQLHSYLNQPLNTTINLIDVGNTPLESINVQMLISKDRKKNKAELSLKDAELKFLVIKDINNKPIIRAISKKPIKVLNSVLRLQVSWPDQYSNIKNTKIHSYAILLDVAKQTNIAKEWYGPIERNEQLWSIAQTLRPTKDISIAQAMVAFRDNNPSAFIHHNINGLMKGVVLQIPNEKQMQKNTITKAIELVKNDNIQWKTKSFSDSQTTQENPRENNQQIEQTPPQSKPKDTEPLQVLPDNNHVNNTENNLQEVSHDNNNLSQSDNRPISPKTLVIQSQNQKSVQTLNPAVDSVIDIKNQLQLVYQQLSTVQATNQSLDVKLHDLQQANQNLQKKLIAKDEIINNLNIRLSHYVNGVLITPSAYSKQMTQETANPQQAMSNILLHQADRMQWLMTIVIAILTIVLLVLIYFILKMVKSEKGKSH